MASISLRNINPARFDYNVYMMSNVGIGTASPSTKLHVNGNLLIETGSPDLYFGTSSASHTNFRIAAQETVSDALEISSGTQSSGASAGSDTYTTRLTVLAGGKVGIGTTAPSQLLHVQSAGGTGAYIRVTAPSYGSANFGMSDTGLRIQTDATVDSSNDADIYFSADSGGEVMRIKESGKVGIGTNAPGELLEVSSGGSTRIRIDSGGGGASSVDLYDGGSLGARINCDSSKNLELMAGGRASADMIIHNDTGYVGIGTTNPHGNLDIKSTSSAYLDLDSATNLNAGIRLYEADAFKWQIYNDGDDSDKYKIDSALGTAVTVAQNGNVGIGTETPSFDLEIAGDVAVNEYIYHNGDTDTYMRFQNDTWMVRTSGNERIYVNSQGRVGIGTNSPAYKLDVNGTVRCNALVFADGTSFSSVGQVGMKALAVNIGNGSSNIVARAQSIVNASYGGIQNGMVIVYYHWYYTYGCGNGTCGATAHRRDFYQVVNGTWTLHFTAG